MWVSWSSLGRLRIFSRRLQTFGRNVEKVYMDFCHILDGSGMFGWKYEVCDESIEVLE